MTAYSLGVEISCDGPAPGADCPDSAAVAARFGSMTPQQVRADGREDGWTRSRRTGRLVDLCPRCTAA